MVYVQSNSAKTLPHHFDAACGLYGAMDNALDYCLVTSSKVTSGKFDNLIKRNLFIGSTEFMREVFKRVGLNDVRLPKNSNRESELITLSEALERAKDGDRLFIKPVEIKLFTGFVLDQSIYSCLNGLPTDTKVIAYHPFDSQITSEWRLYVHNHKVIDARNYAGDFMISPDYTYAYNLSLENKKTFPCAYTIDIGVLESGENVVIEYNDMWAIGNYGLENDRYFRLLKDRYFEIIKQA